MGVMSKEMCKYGGGFWARRFFFELKRNRRHRTMGRWRLKETECFSHDEQQGEKVSADERPSPSGCQWSSNRVGMSSCIPSSDRTFLAAPWKVDDVPERSQVLRRRCAGVDKEFVLYVFVEPRGGGGGGGEQGRWESCLKRA